MLPLKATTTAAVAAATRPALNSNKCASSPLLRAGTRLRQQKANSNPFAVRSLPRSLYTLPSSTVSGSRRSMAYQKPNVLQQRSISTTPKVSAAEEAEEEDPLKAERFVDEADVVIVGAGPAGLSAAIRIKQRAEKEGKDIRVVVVEKGGEVGAHTLSGAVIEPSALSELIPDWKERGAPLLQPALHDSMVYLTKKWAIPMPHPPQMSNKGNYIVSLSNVVKWIGEQAEEIGVEVFPGFAASEVIYDEQGHVKGIATNDVGLDKDFKPKDNFERGMEIHGKVTLFGEGCHGSLTKSLISKFKLRDEGQYQTYGLGIKEVWEIDPKKHKPGTVIHTLGYPLDYQTYGGSFIYHLQDNMISLGLVVGLDYQNPYLSPYKEFQKFKDHPFVRQLLEGGRVLSYGARALIEGGFQAVPRLAFPGGALIGDSAGFVNVPKIKGTHNAIRSGMMAADAAFDAIVAGGDAGSMEPIKLDAYQEAYLKSPIYKELYEVRNVRPSFNTPLGLFGGSIWSGLDTFFLRGRVPFTFKVKHPDHQMLKPASHFRPIDYPKPDGKVTFDLLTSVSRTGTNHAENQPVHLRLKDPKVQVAHNLPVFDGPEQKFCPAGVYEYIDDEARPGHKRFNINSQNCIHCKTCDIKDPSQNINWTVPEGGGGPQYVDT
ncbi:hypothetical protein H4219_003780 [Mycoemilia scoparia]|uniref:Electron transfer flavoprotein-ubiquinone oxidoreductase n=1 Tax=Mycoemilia scoparia TaxID=417184 RepID=A0A9W8A0C5_9FUNG|nr:hypothetical protein H4219_003780 [Mycoemilia scoparia]